MKVALGFVLILFLSGCGMVTYEPRPTEQDLVNTRVLTPPSLLEYEGNEGAITKSPDTDPPEPLSPCPPPTAYSTSGATNCSPAPSPSASPVPHPIDPPDTETVIDITRVCSRAQVPLFFEEARPPHLVVTAVKGRGTTGTPVKVLTSENLSLNLLQGQTELSIRYNLASLKREYPTTWSTLSAKVEICRDSDKDGECGDEPSNHSVLFAGPAGFMLSNPREDLSVMVFSGRGLSAENNPEQCDFQSSPLILDLKGDGIPLSGKRSGVTFDLNADGRQLITGWVTDAEDALLARDLNGNGKIDSGAELFGSGTTLRDGRKAENGFEALKELDQNQDNIFSPQDAHWRELLLWKDRNANGVTDHGELLPLANSSVTSIRLDFTPVTEIDSHGNQTLQRSIFFGFGDKGAFSHLIVDIWFNARYRP